MRREAGGPRDGMGFACVLFSLKRLHDEISLCPMSAKGKRQRQKAKGKRQKKKKKKKKRLCGEYLGGAKRNTPTHAERHTQTQRQRDAHRGTGKQRDTRAVSCGANVSKRGRGLLSRNEANLPAVPSIVSAREPVTFTV